MGFLAERFAGASLEWPTVTVQVPDLGEWFEGAPVWRVRGLCANDLAKVELADRRAAVVEALTAALAGGTAAEITAETRALLGRSAGIEEVYARQIEILVLGSVAPVMDHALAAKLGETQPVTFKALVNAILAATGQGATAPKKPPASTEMPA